MMRATRQKFDIPFTVVDKGSGVFMAALEDVNLSQGSTLEWVAPRRILKVDPSLALKGGMVIRSGLGMNYMVADYAAVETSMGVPFRAFKLYESTSMGRLQRRSTIIDQRTLLEREGILGAEVLIYASFEPLQEAFDRELRIPNEKSRLITNYEILEGDVINGDKVIEAHKFLGLYGAVLG